MNNSNKLSNEAQIEYNRIIEMSRLAKVSINIKSIKAYCKAIDSLRGLNPFNTIKTTKRTNSVANLLNKGDNDNNFESLFDKRK